MSGVRVTNEPPKLQETLKEAPAKWEGLREWGSSESEGWTINPTVRPATEPLRANEEMKR